MSFWDDNPGAADRLRALWDEGLSTAQIANRLGTTKNAVISKRRRLDCAARPSPIRAVANGINVRKHIRAINRAAPRKIVEAVVWSPFKRCQWPLSDGRPWRFCACAEVVPGKPYCEAHCVRAFSRHPMQDAA